MSENSAKKKTGAENINWDLSDLYSSNEDPQLAKDKKKVLEQAEAFGNKYRGKVSELDAGAFKGMLDEYEDILDLAGKLGSFAYLQWSTDTTNTSYGKLVAESNELSSEVSQKLVFLDVEWLEIPDEDAHKLIESEELSKYKHYLESSRRYKEHVLEEKQEQILSAKSVTGRSAWVRFFDETLGSAKFELDGEELSEQEVLSKLHESDRDLRIRAHASLTNKFNDLSRSLTFVFNTLLADKSTNDKLRKYDSWIDSRNLSNQTDKETVNALVDSVTSKYDLVQRYYKLKQQLLGLDEMKDYDRYAPIMKNEATIDWTSAKEMVLDSYTNFHPQMGKITEEFFEKSWIDAAIKPGKRGGAYSAGTVPSAHPYVFMNF
ncbi:MAG TPA: oligoendopeptidase F, partial [Balneolaceae bacterium]|nr:oligoendopeptidase F [Balneolaceae bacterium]